LGIFLPVRVARSPRFGPQWVKHFWDSQSSGENGKKRVFDFQALLKSSFFCVIRLFSAAARRVTPSFVKVFHQPSDDYRKYWGMPEAAGAKARCAKSPKERLLVSMRVSPENLNNQI
jgi:hypothetical protein